ncbi:MAG: esterase-like activity of phytase family protein [Desulfarculaceae bacterium]|nr:esterase-like activity of phytase family protein [Desulfarculaceae bacterium]
MRVRLCLKRLLPVISLALLLACAASPPYPAGAEGRAAVVRSEAVELDAADRARVTVGPLRYLGGLELSSPDPAFGGLSGLALGPDGALMAISDKGWWLSARLESGKDGRPLAVQGARLGPLLGEDGLPLKGKRNSDAEGLAAWKGGWLVSFERRHRLAFYPPPQGLGGRPRPLVMPSWLERFPANSGVEAVGVLADGRLLLLAEQDDGEARSLGALGDGHAWQKVGYPLSGGFHPTALAPLPGGGCLVLERAYSLAQGARARLGFLPAEALRPGAELRPRVLATLAPPLTTDNFEGLAVLPAGPGRLRVYLMSDDNFSPMQRTLLLAFELPWPQP